MADFFHAALLRGMAKAWIVNDPLSQSDVIVVLGGGPDTRPFEAARLFHLGLAPKILLTNPKLTPSEQLGLVPSGVDLARRILLKKEVPENVISVTTEIVNSTYDESMAVRDWAQANNAKRIIIPTDIFHTRRVRWLFRKELTPLGIQVEVEAVPVRDYTEENWWQDETGMVAFQTEIIKYVFYRLKY